MQQPREHFKYLGFISSAIVATLIISNVSAAKLVEIGPIITDGGTLLFPLSYIFGDILTEVYGYSASRRVIYTAFFWMALAAIMFQFVAAMPAPAEQGDFAEMFGAVLSPVPSILVASLLGFFTGEFVNSYVLAKMKVWTAGRRLWTRTIGSTAFGQLADTAVFYTVATVLNVFPSSTLLQLIWDTYWIKVTIEVLFTPLTYQIVNWLKRNEGVDYYDIDTNFNPFAVDKLFE